MFSMSRRWWIVAISLGVVGSLAIVETLVVPRSAYLPCDPFGYCPYPIEYDTGSMLIRAGVTFFLGLGIGSLIFLIVNAIRLAIGRVHGTSSGGGQPSV